MYKSPIVVEIKVEQNGLFITTTSILMCGSVVDATQAYKNQEEMAKGLMEWQSDDFVSEERLPTSFFKGVHFAAKEGK